MSQRTFPAIIVLVLVSGASAPGQSTSTPASQQPEPINPTQEIAKEQPEGPAIMVGPTQIRIGGYLGLTGIFRSTNSGGGPGTDFAAIPYDDTAQGHMSETRLSAQSSRLSIRVNAPASPGRPALAGYFEMDFAGSTPGNVAVTSSGYGLRLRHAFGEVQRGKFLIAAGQAFSLMTPAKRLLSIWPSDYDMSQAVDMNYVLGMVWGRSPQVRFTYRPAPSFNWSFSVENPEQQIQDAVTLPACCADDLAAQYNTGDNGVSVPNLMPDIVSRIAYNHGNAFHLDAGGVVRAFRHSLKPYTDSVHQAGGGASVNGRVNAGAGTRIIGQVSYGAGMGRYIGGLVPDVSITADGSIHPIRTTSWVTGVEQAVRPKLSVSGYYSGVRTANSYSQDIDGSFIGFGFPGSGRSNNKRLHEITGVVAVQPWSLPEAGSFQWNSQVSWLERSPWSPDAGPQSASAFMFLTQIRYNLP